MPFRFLKKLFKKKNRGIEIDPDEIFLDSSNLPQFDVYQFEGRIEKAIPRRSLIGLGIFFLLVGGLFLSRAWKLQVVDGATYNQKSLNNTLHSTTLFAQRGTVLDRTGVPLVWNVENANNPDFALRQYIEETGFAHVLGYVKYPTQDKTGFYYINDYAPEAGVEKFYNSMIGGTNGSKIVEINALGKSVSENVIQPAKPGENVTLSLDANLQHKLYETIATIAQQIHFVGGAGGIMDLKTGEMLAVTSYPEYDPNLLSTHKDAAKLQAEFNNPRNPFLDRFTDGLYAPGSIVKPFVALAALSEHVITPEKQILSTGQIAIPNIYDPTKSTIFRDWRAQGWVDMRHAIAVSSDVYFYEVGGGFQDQPGLGITNLEKYLKLFGLGTPVKAPFFAGSQGTIPDPLWKKQNFNGEQWLLGDTYHTAIGQYGTQVTPAQMMVAIGTIANDGLVPQPTILKNDPHNTPARWSTVAMPKEDYQVVKEGMRLGVVSGVASALNIPEVKVAAKTGTAEIGTTVKNYENSWVEGFFPYDNPRYAFVVVMDRGPVGNPINASYVGEQVIQWMAQNEPQYLSATTTATTL